MFRSILIFFVTALSFPAAAQITLLPASPRVHDMIEIVMDGGLIGQEWSNSPEVAMAGNKITVTLPLTGGSGIPANLDWALGAFPAGDYQVEVVRRTTNGATTSIASSSFNVAPRSGNVPRTDYSDLYYNPSESGWGLNIQQHPSDKIFATWFVYGLDNKPTWYVLPDGQWSSDHEYSGTLYRTVGSYYADPWNPNAKFVIPVGSMKLTFTKYNAVLINYTIDNTSGVKAAVRQGF